MINLTQVLDHGYVKLLNIAGPSGTASDIDPANVARTSFDQRDSGHTYEDDLRLCDYLIRNRHTTPFEMIQVWLEMKLPIFVARQFVRHRTVSINEVSARYTTLESEWYIPPLDEIKLKPETSKQGRHSDTYMGADFFVEDLNAVCAQSYDRYKEYLRFGVAPEICRLFLHVNHYTKWIWRQDLHNLMHFLALRDHPHAQWEAQEYARATTELLRQRLPELINLYDKYRR